MAERAITLMVALVVGILVARHLGPAEFGRLSYLLAFVGLFTPLAALGLSFVVTRALLERPEHADRILFTSLILRVGGGALALVLMLTVHALMDPAADQERMLLALLGLSAISLAVLTYESWFQAHIAAKYSTLARSVALITGAGIKVWLVAKSMPVEAFVLAGVVDNLLLAVAIALAYKLRTRAEFVGSYDPTEAKALLQKSKWLIVSGLMAAVYLRIDLIMLRQMSSASEVGIYAVAARLSEAWYFVPAAIASSFFPALLQSRASNQEAYHASLQKICNHLLLLALVVAILVALLSVPVIRALYGVEYGDAAPVLALHVWGGLFISMRALLSKWLIVEELYRYSLLSQGLGALVNISLNLFLIPRYGAMGAAVATLLSYAIASYVVLFFSPATRPMAHIMSRALVWPLGIGFLASGGRGRS